MAVLKVGVIIGRFQVPELHAGHHKLFEHVREHSDQIVVLLGISPVDGHTAENPLTFNQRCAIVKDCVTHWLPTNPPMMEAPVVFPLMDMRTNEEWSAQIDNLLRSVYPNDNITLYGGRDSFVESYRGKYPIARMEAVPVIPVAGTTNRAAIKEANSPDFYRGQIYALQRQYPKVYPTVDVALYRPDEQEMLLIQRADSGRWCFPGGFVDPTDESFERAAQRELMEETGLHSELPLEYVGSYRINDFRYRASRDKIITTFFFGQHVYGTPTPNPTEVQDYKWVDEKTALTLVSMTHMPLAVALVKYLGHRAELQLHG